MQGDRRVVITGVGLVTPLGNNVADSWDNALAGVSGAAPIHYFDASSFPVTFSTSVKQDFAITDYISRKDARRMDPFIHYGMAAGLQALEDSGLEITDANAARVGISIGSGIGGLPGIEVGHSAYLNGGVRKVSPFFVPSNLINMISGNLSIMVGAKGPNVSLVTACSTATHSIGDAARMIVYGDADVMLSGGSENSTSPMGVGGFAAAKALSTRNDSPQTASRPWDIDRDGFVIGDGAGVVVLEEYEHAKARGAQIYCELVGFGMSGDAYHMTAPAKNGEGAARCMNNALADAGLNSDEIQYVNAHGTSTPIGDIAETQALKTTFGEHAYKLAVNSTKSMTGHLLGAAGGIEAIFTVLAIKNQVSPPTINIFNQDPACDLNYVANNAREMKIDAAISNSFGFGGTNGTLVFKRI